jgi:hypothetical protein
MKLTKLVTRPQVLQYLQEILHEDKNGVLVPAPVTMTPRQAWAFLKILMAKVWAPYIPWEEVIVSAARYAEARDVSKKALLAKIEEILLGKGAGYGMEDNIYENFDGLAFYSRTSPQVGIQWFMGKHVDFLLRAEKTGKVYGLEGYLERVCDIILYAALGLGLDLRAGRAYD